MHNDNAFPALSSDPHADMLVKLKVINRLEVGPVKVEKQRLVAPYTVWRNGISDSKALIYHFEEDVFDPAEPESQNLANIIAAQVALNYGLFCDEIVFHGIFDNVDQQFLWDMADNTATEIYVKKIMEPNPFLIGDVAKTPLIHRKSYLQSKLLFPDSVAGATAPTFNEWKSSPQRNAILSSGGKDSLLTFGLLNELGFEAHPVFGNESGRHWFTALNSYRYFKKNIPTTSRVWINSDRIFSWMLRKLPFIRADFANVRSDEYPIRLWTVAVFLFGTLPVIRKRGIGRVFIGDEYDTTWTASYKGINHFNGLFDQSRYFDIALTNYYRAKGWMLEQYSILRPLSELLILKILTKRYPELQENQVSCHAAHKEGERVSPCGKCEKCRRIVGMLLAFDANPERCGYSQTQISHCLQEIATKDLHQESVSISQLKWMLSNKGLIKLSEEEKSQLQPQPQVLQLRFHPENSPFNELPADLQKPLNQIYSAYANGAVIYNKHKWMTFDPLKPEKK